MSRTCEGRKVHGFSRSGFRFGGQTLLFFFVVSPMVRSLTVSIACGFGSVHWTAHSRPPGPWYMQVPEFAGQVPRNPQDTTATKL